MCLNTERIGMPNSLHEMPCLVIEWSTVVLIFVKNLFEWVPSITAKPVLSGHSKVDKTKILMTNGSLMKV